MTPALNPATPSGAVAILKLILLVAPEAIQAVAPLVKDIAALFKAHPRLSLQDFIDAATAIHSDGDALTAFILADQATHAPAPAAPGATL